MDKTVPRWAWAAIAVGILVFSRPHMALHVYGGYDPHCFVEQLYRILGHPYPQCGPNHFFPGLAWIWTPLASLAYGASLLLGTHPHHPVMASVLVTSAACWTLALVLVHRFYCRTIGEAHRSQRNWWWALCIAMGFPALYYGFSRPSLAHAPEFALSVAAAWALLDRRHRLAIGLAIVLFALRPQNAWAIFWVGLVIAERRDTLGKWCLGVGSLCLLWAMSRLFWGHYHHVTLAFLLGRLTWENFGQVLWGSDWGLIWTAPWWLWVVLRGARRRLTWGGRGSWAVLLLHLALVTAWRANGGDFGYRYLVATVGPCLWVWKETFSGWQRGERAILSLGALWMVWLTWIYRSTPETLPRVSSPGWSPTLPYFQWTALEGLIDPHLWMAPWKNSLPVTAVCNASSLCTANHGFPALTQMLLLWGLLFSCLGFLWWSRRPHPR